MTTTVQEFQNDPDRVAGLRAALANEYLKEALEILRTKGPGTIRSDITPTYASIRLGHVAGWSEFAETLLGMSERPPITNIDNPRLITLDDGEE